MSQPIPRQSQPTEPDQVPPSAAVGGGDPPRGSPGEQLERMTLLEHLEELRNRLLRSLIAVAVAFMGCWAFAPRIFAFLARPVREMLPEGSNLVYLSVTDPFVLYVKVAALAAVFVSSPVLMYQFWRFIAPGLYAREKRYAVPFVLVGSLLFLGGGLFAYSVVFPFAAEYLMNLGSDLQPVLTVDRYFAFSSTSFSGSG